MYEFASPLGAKSSLEEISLVPAGSGAYEISVDGRLVYSKLATGRHISDEDAVELVRKAL